MPRAHAVGDSTDGGRHAGLAFGVITCLLLLSPLHDRANACERACWETIDLSEFHVRVTRVDVESKRLFVVFTATGVDADRLTIRAAVPELGDLIRTCLPEWGPHWSLSFFSDESCAGYKLEPDVFPHYRDGTWHNAYAAEFTNDDRTVVYFPALQDRRTHEVIPEKVPHAGGNAPG